MLPMDFPAKLDPSMPFPPEAVPVMLPMGPVVTARLSKIPLAVK